ncbi:uncharacterized protein LAESUDRAFT_760801 [Laetiporus sulphureus 93-53]|uniref:Uncharacterized protein n=1 Tax=Laetiporus sulphureus 93-53 TaxID=1314785 RepID=A0A165DFF6_9APHY|nr:uncharacterized protein LAESUDRAFT_760801 [Laetiporus sulphureus 93-53]KZT04777.1 hypothetical protein LAESUDRAFT_760801 [Laetiporus sulphureus 93-53]
MFMRYLGGGVGHKGMVVRMPAESDHAGIPQDGDGSSDEDIVDEGQHDEDSGMTFNDGEQSQNMEDEEYDYGYVVDEENEADDGVAEGDDGGRDDMSSEEDEDAGVPFATL